MNLSRDHSHRKAFIGSIFAARRTGMLLANIATLIKSSYMHINVTGSAGLPTGVSVVTVFGMILIVSVAAKYVLDLRIKA